ncbi:MAG: sodium/glutamate symporter [Deltaproteobacteria bacterium]|jgi:ESS family glutamate:Na+ symporter|nr:sodium/glutamate symporter [Deltaproteobacteria bacterium]MBW2532753.1 sodium/glutamate symporter [Deltaproteobacteria bacterium]
MTLELGLVETSAVALAVLFLGYLLNRVVPPLRKYNIPEPVVGGIVFAALSTVAFSQFNFAFKFDMTLKTPLMLVFFTTVGLGANVKLLAKGGPKLFWFMLIATLYLIVQDGTGVLFATLSDMHPLMGLVAGSITLTGGHATWSTYAEVFKDFYNMKGGMEVAMASATFGLVLGGIIGGPVGRSLIKRYKLEPSEPIHKQPEEQITYDPEDRDHVTPRRMMETMLIILICLSVGTAIYDWLLAKGVTVPASFVSLMIGMLITNVCDFTKVYSFNRETIDLWGTMGLSVFLAMALMSLRLWELVHLAGPMLLILLAQTVMMILFAYFVTFRLMGKNYDAAIMAGGHCGFGLGATPTAVANMESLTSRFGASPQAFLVVPLCGAFFLDLTNALVLQAYMAMPFVK